MSRDSGSGGAAGGGAFDPKEYIDDIIDLYEKDYDLGRRHGIIFHFLNRLIFNLGIIDYDIRRNEASIASGGSKEYQAYLKEAKFRLKDVKNQFHRAFGKDVPIEPLINEARKLYSKFIDDPTNARKYIEDPSYTLPPIKKHLEKYSSIIKLPDFVQEYLENKKRGMDPTQAKIIYNKQREIVNKTRDEEFLSGLSGMLVHQRTPYSTKPYDITKELDDTIKSVEEFVTKPFDYKHETYFDNIPGILNLISDNGITQAPTEALKEKIKNKIITPLTNLYLKSLTLKIKEENPALEDKDINKLVTQYLENEPLHRVYNYDSDYVPEYNAKKTFIFSNIIKNKTAVNSIIKEALRETEIQRLRDEELRAQGIDPSSFSSEEPSLGGGAGRGTGEPLKPSSDSAEDAAFAMSSSGAAAGGGGRGGAALDSSDSHTSATSSVATVHPAGGSIEIRNDIPNSEGAIVYIRQIDYPKGTLRNIIRIANLELSSAFKNYSSLDKAEQRELLRKYRVIKQDLEDISESISIKTLKLQGGSARIRDLAELAKNFEDVDPVLLRIINPEEEVIKPLLELLAKSEKINLIDESDAESISQDELLENIKGELDHPLYSSLKKYLNDEFYEIVKLYQPHEAESLVHGALSSGDAASAAAGSGRSAGESSKTMPGSAADVAIAMGSNGPALGGGRMPLTAAGGAGSGSPGASSAALDAAPETSGSSAAGSSSSAEEISSSGTPFKFSGYIGISSDVESITFSGSGSSDETIPTIRVYENKFIKYANFNFITKNMRFIIEKGAKLLAKVLNFGESKVSAEEGHHISVKSMPDSERGTEVIVEDKIINEDFVLTEILRASKITLSDKVTFSGIDGTFLLIEPVEGDIFEESSAPSASVAGGGGGAAASDSLSLLGVELS